MLAWLPLLAADPTSSNYWITQGPGWAAAFVVSGVVGVLWRRDVRRTDQEKAEKAAELSRMQDAHTREVDLLKAERARETTRADAETAARKELEREIRDRHLLALTQAVDTLAVVRDSRRRT